MYKCVYIIMSIYKWFYKWVLLTRQISKNNGLSYFCDWKQEWQMCIISSWHQLWLNLRQRWHVSLPMKNKHSCQFATRGTRIRPWARQTAGLGHIYGLSACRGRLMELAVYSLLTQMRELKVTILWFFTTCRKVLYWPILWFWIPETHIITAIDRLHAAITAIEFGCMLLIPLSCIYNFPFTTL